jgi:hypothetical protein
VAGLVVGAEAMAGALWLLAGLLSWLPEPGRAAALLGLVAIALGRDLGLVAFPLPERTRLVPRSVFEPGLTAGALRFGIELGVGFRTRLPTTVPYVLAAALLLGLADGRTVGVVALAFAAGRSVAPAHRLVTKAGERWDTAVAAVTRRLALSSSLAAAAALAQVGVAALLPS